MRHNSTQRISKNGRYLWRRDESRRGTRECVRHLDIARSRAAEQEILNLLDEPPSR